jgi:hypothetical protein
VITPPAEWMAARKQAQQDAAARRSVS